MSYEYIDGSEHPFVLVNLDKYDGMDFDEAIDLIRASGVYPAPLLVGRSGSAISGDTEVLREEQRHIADPVLMLDAFGELADDACFITSHDFAAKYSAPKLLQRQFKNTVTALNDRNPPGKKLILLTRNGDPQRYFDEHRYGEGSFRKIPAEASASLNEFAEAVARPLPKPGEPWDFSDNEKWIAFIDSLNLKQIQDIVKQGLHLHSVRRMRHALNLVQPLFEKRERALEMMVACAIARVNVVFLGPPGTAKSLMVRTFSKALGVHTVSRPINDEHVAAREARQQTGQFRSKRRMFEYLLTRYTTPEEIFGGADINLLLSAGIHGRRTAGMLPQAETAFLDEIFKANSAILNTLLSITNERIFYNMGQAFKVNLAFVIGASNETPAEEELGALFDRFPIRVPCLPVGPAQLRKLVSDSHDFELGRVFPEAKSEIQRVSCLNDLRLLSKIVLGGIYGGANAFSSSAFEDHFFELLLTIRRDYGVSDRTPAQILRVCRSLALLDEGSPASQLEVEHLRAWGYVAPKMSAAPSLQRIVQSKIRRPGLFDET